MYMMKKFGLSLICIFSVSSAFSSSCDQFNSSHFSFIRAVSQPNGIFCYYEDGSNVKVREVPTSLSGPWHASGWSAWCGSPDHTTASLCQFA